MKKTIVILLLITASQNLMAQIDTAAIRKSLMTESTRSELIQKCRGRILDAISESDRDRATELMLYAKTTFDDDNYQTFSPDEFWNLAIWLRKYKMASSEIVLSPVTGEIFNRHQNKLDMFLLTVLQSKISNDSTFFVNDISRDTSLTSCERDFLLLYIRNLKRMPTYQMHDGTLINNSGLFNPDTLNQASNEFLQQHPGSDFEPFVRSAMRYEYKQNGLMYGGAAFLGATLVKGDAHDLISGGFGIGLDVNLSYKGVVAGAQLNISTNHKCQDEFSGNDGTLYDSGTKFDGVSPNFYVGYWFLYRGISVLPSIGYGGFRLEVDSSNGNDNLKGCHLKSDWNPVLSLEVGFGNSVFAPTDTYATNGRSALGLKYSFQPVNINLQDGDISGATHRIALIYRVSACKLKRIY